MPRIHPNQEKHMPKELTDADYEMNDREYVWIGIGSISVYIRRDGDGVSVEVYPRGEEAASPPIATCQAQGEKQ